MYFQYRMGEEGGRKGEGPLGLCVGVHDRRVDGDIGILPFLFYIWFKSTNLFENVLLYHEQVYISSLSTFLSQLTFMAYSSMGTNRPLLSACFDC